MNLMLFISMYSAINGLDPALVKAVIKVESNWDSSAIGRHNDLGLMQIRQHIVAPHRTKKELLNPFVNVTEGIRHLGWTKKHCKHKVELSWLSCYNMGVSKASSLKHPKEFDYVKKVRKVYYEYKRMDKLRNYRNILDVNFNY